MALIHEGRFTLDSPVSHAQIPVPCLSIRDCYAEKLLANSDRGADPTQLYRDLVDLAALRSALGPIPKAAWHVAASAYGSSVERDLDREVKRFWRDSDRLRKLERLGVEDLTRVVGGVEQLARDRGVRLEVDDE